MSFDNFVAWNARSSLQRIDVLRKALVQETFLRKEADKRMGKGWAEPSREKFMSERVDWGKKKLAVNTFCGEKSTPRLKHSAPRQGKWADRSEN